MLISALCDYCDTLEQRGELPPNGYAELGISYLIELTEDGALSSIIDLREKSISVRKGKGKITYTPRKYMFPERPRTTSIAAKFVEVRGGYIFGLEYRKTNSQGLKEYLDPEAKGDTEKKKKKLFEQHKSFVKEVTDDFGVIDNPSVLVSAYMRFAQNWSPKAEVRNPVLLALGTDLNSAKFAFCLAGHPEKMLQDDPDVKKRWEVLYSTSEDTPVCQCAVTGQQLPVARIHDSLITGKGVGVKNAGTTPSLVNFKPESFLSYNHEQGENACISSVAMKKYTKALNWLLSSTKHHNYLDGLTLVYWSSDANESNDEVMQMLLTKNTDYFSANELDEEISSVVKDAENADISEARLLLIDEKISPETDYYILALEPNDSRIQVKFIYRQKFGKILENIAKHQTDLSVSGHHGTIPLWQLKNELISPKSSTPQQLDVMFLSVLRSILQGTDYPSWLLSTTVRRVRTDRNEKESDNKKSDFKHLNYVRAGIIKACIVRHTKEDIAMALDRENTNPAYLCGRLFALLQKVQEDSANPQKLNRTIEDVYFGAASTNPAAIMPKLLKLSKHHMAKLKRNHPDWAVSDSKQLDEIISKLGTSFPGTLDLYDQGRFMLGYYQQNASRFEKKGDIENVGA